MITRLKIEGMTCGHCVQSVKDFLARVPGVTKVLAVDLATGEAQVEGSATFEAMAAAVNEAGYEAARAA